MSRYKTVEEYADHVARVTRKQLAVLCRQLGPTHPTTLAIADLCTEAANITQQGKMRQEQSGPNAYDLGALHVQTDTPSNSETGWEQEE